MRVLLLVLFLAAVVVTIPGADAARGACRKRAARCARTWAISSGGETDVEERCHMAMIYKMCLEAVRDFSGCPRVKIPMTLRHEELIYCNMPKGAYLDETPCGVAQLKCAKAWAVQSTGKVKATERCEVAKEWLTCMQGTMENLFCPDFGNHERQLKTALAVNCQGDESARCEASQQTCRAPYDGALQTNSDSQEGKCVAAREYRDCLANTARSGNCDESVVFPEDLDKVEEENCADYTPRASCEEQANACKAQWYPDPNMPRDNRCKSARRLKQCLLQIIANGGCPGGYTLDMDAQVALVMNCQVAYGFSRDECEQSARRCHTEFQVRRKYLSSYEEECDNLIDARTCLGELKDDKVCSESKIDQMNLYEDEEDACKERILAQCKDKSMKCEEDFDAAIKDEILPTKLCAAATTLKSCIIQATTFLCTIKFPRSKLKETEAYCGIPDSTPCELKAESCASLFLADDPSDVCERANLWQECLQSLRDISCDVSFPQELEDVKTNNNCPLDVDVSSSTEDVGTGNNLTSTEK